MIPVAGQRVGPYEILGRLGSGGMGLVFSAWDARLQRDVAIKLLREEFLRGDSRERFMMEARAASGLNHPNICTIFDIGEQEDHPYLVMELLKGETLRARIAAGPLPPEQILSVGIEIADGLAAAHNRGIIHRDIKPANIFMVAKPGGGWQPKVLDFGLAKTAADDGLDPRFHMTGAGSTVGTVAYMSPEQARGEMLDARSDLFALGIVLYEMATCRVPFDGLTSALIFVKLLGQPPEPVRRLAPGFPRALERIILKLLAKDREARFQSAAELCAALRGVVLKGPPSQSRSTWLSQTLRSAVSRASTHAIQSPRSSPAYQTAIAADSAADDSVVIHPIRRTRTASAGSIEARRESSPSARTAASESTLSAPFSEQEISRRSRAPVGRPASFGFVIAAEAAAPLTKPVFTPDVQEPASSRSRWPWVLAALALLLLIAGWIYLRRSRETIGTASHQSLLLGYIVNHSGEPAFEGTILEALRLDLEQSQQLSVTGSAATAAASQLAATVPSTVEDARRVAKLVGANSFLQGEISRGADTYSIEVTVYNTGSGNVVFRSEETAMGTEQIAPAIDRLALEIRRALGERAGREPALSTSLARQASANLEALEFYTGGLASDTTGRPLEAMAAFQRAVAADPRFVQAWMRLAALYAGQHAEIAAAEAATHARDASAGSGNRNRLLAEASYQLYSTGDYPQALRVLDQTASDFPLESSVASQRALALRLEGRSQTALEIAEGALARNAFDAEASRQAVYALLALDRRDAARKLEDRAEKQGQRHADLRMLLGYLGDPSAPLPEAERDQLGAQAFRAQLLDASGQLSQGLSAWRTAAATAQANPALASASAYMLAQAALDRALMEDCAAAAPLATEADALPHGPDAIFAAGMAGALCRNSAAGHHALLALMGQYPQSFAVKSYYLGELNAVDQIRSRDIESALTSLASLKPTAALSMSSYLTALAHAAAKQWQPSAESYSTVLQSRGSTLLTNPVMYSMAELGLARAQGGGSNPQAAAPAYAAFLRTWNAADPGSAFMLEARKHTP